MSSGPRARSSTRSGIPSCPAGRNGRPSGPRAGSAIGTTSTRRRWRRSGPRPSTSTRSWPRRPMPTRDLNWLPLPDLPVVLRLHADAGSAQCRPPSVARRSAADPAQRRAREPTTTALGYGSIDRSSTANSSRRLSMAGSAGSNCPQPCSRPSAGMTRSRRRSAGRSWPGPIDRAARLSLWALSQRGQGNPSRSQSRPGRIGSSRSRSAGSSHPFSVVRGTRSTRRRIGTSSSTTRDTASYRGRPVTGCLWPCHLAADGTGHFAFGPPIKTMTVTQGEGGDGSKAPLTFTFESVPMLGALRTTMSVLCILQARVSSTRLPGKVLKPILGEPMLARQIERIARAERVDALTVATSDEPSDDGVAGLCERLGVDCYRGSLDDVLDRFYQAAQRSGPSHVMRLTGDCPLTDPAILDALVELHLAGDFDYSSNVEVRTYPVGLDAEIFRYELLVRAWRNATSPYEREHVTPFMQEGGPGAATASSKTGSIDRNLTLDSRLRRGFRFRLTCLRRALSQATRGSVPTMSIACCSTIPR